MNSSLRDVLRSLSVRSVRSVQKLSVMCRFCSWGGRCSAGCIGGFLFELPDSFLHLLARFERNYPFLSDIHSLAGARVACFSRGPLFHFEHSKVPKLDAVVGDQRLDDRVKRLLNNLFGLQLSQTNLVG